MATKPDPEQSKRNRDRLLEASAAATLLLTRRRNEITAAGIARGHGLGTIATNLSDGIQPTVLLARELAAKAAASRVRAEALALGLEAGGIDVGLAAGATNVFRLKRISDRLAALWLKLAQKSEAETVSAAIAEANAGTVARLSLIGQSEASTAYNTGRLKAAREVYPDVLAQRVWDADHCKRMCAACGRADGTIVGLRESFPLGEPGSVHPHCHCTWSVVILNRTATETERQAA